MNKTAYDLSVEINGISMLIIGLSNQLDNSATYSLNAEAMNDALHGISNYLDRIADDLSELDCINAEKAGTVL